MTPALTEAQRRALTWGSRVSETEKYYAFRMADSGRTVTSIAQALRRPRSTIQKHLRLMGVPPKTRGRPRKEKLK